MVKKLLLFLFFLLTYSTATFAQNDDLRDKQILESADNIIHDIIASPNPFSVTTRIRFIADEVIDVEFHVKDLLGNSIQSDKIKTKKGGNSITFYREDLASGIYIYSIKTKTKIISKRIVIK
ncbi:MAG: T9SS type A sorting domain-containing protein [Bacteroidota bacterium]